MTSASSPDISYPELLTAIAGAGVVGMGGAGFPTHLKLRPELNTVIINGAECEPLVRVDYHLLDRHPEQVLEGAEQVARATGAGEVVLAVKTKNRRLATRFESLPATLPVRVIFLEDVYPSGDEFFVIRDACGEILPEGTIPVDRGYMVSNAATFQAIAAAVHGRPLTHRLVTVCGAVRQQVTIDTPVGASFADLIAAAGGFTCDRPHILEGGVMMGSLADVDHVVAKTTSALVVLPEHNPAILERTRSLKYSVRTGEHTCCQCLKCTELCSRYLLGHAIEPHKIMRLIGSARDYQGLNTPMLFNCTGCGLCSLLACPFDLTPRRLILAARRGLPRTGLPMNPAPQPRPSAELFTASTHRLIQHLNLGEYDRDNRFLGPLPTPEILRIPLDRHIGPPAEPVVAPGDTVTAGQLIARPPSESAGAAVHAPLAGTVESVDRHIVIQTLSTQGASS